MTDKIKIVSSDWARLPAQEEEEESVVWIISCITKKQNMPIYQTLGSLIIHKSLLGKEKDCIWWATMSESA